MKFSFVTSLLSHVKEIDHFIQHTAESNSFETKGRECETNYGSVRTNAKLEFVERERESEYQKLECRALEVRRSGDEGVRGHG